MTGEVADDHQSYEHVRPPVTDHDELKDATDSTGMKPQLVLSQLVRLTPSSCQCDPDMTDISDNQVGLHVQYNKIIRTWRGIVVRLPVLPVCFPYPCARLTAGRVTNLWVKHPLSVNQLGRLSLLSLRGWLNE